MKTYELKELRSKLKFGDAKQIADECGTSVTTFQKALRGEIDTPIAKIVIDYTTKVVKQRDERLEYLKKVIKPLYIRNEA
jgi:hypothetical protein